MAPFNVADLKARATKAKDYTSEKFTNTRDRYSSAQSKDINWETEEFKRKKPPPLPPPLRRSKPGEDGSEHARNGSVSSVVDGSESQGPSPVVSKPSVPLPPTRGRPPLPPVRRGSIQSERPSSTSSPVAQDPSPTRVAPSRTGSKIDWANLSQEDKQVFFGWLDEYFARYLGSSISPRSIQDTVQHVSVEDQKQASSPTPATSRAPASAPAPTPKPVIAPAPAPASGPPPIPMATRPKLPSFAFSEPDSDAFTTSHPPSSTYGSAALDLAYFFSPDSHWDTPWYSNASTFLPPPIQKNPHIMSMAAWEIHGGSKTLFVCILFSDLSVCWYTVKFPTTGTSDPNDVRAVQRSARYLPRPKAMDGDALLAAHETYGETIAGFAESFLGTGQFCARGECWDLASEALKYFQQFDYIPRPISSISRTHGHLIFEGKILGDGAQVGRWRGGDDRVRRGDIAEWRSVRITMGRGSWATLGDPDHTAVIVSDTVPRLQVHDGMSITPGEVGTLEVIEQSAGQLPKQQKYDMAGMTEGEVWIYRPVGMEMYLGIAELQPRCPDDVGALSI